MSLASVKYVHAKHEVKKLQTTVSFVTECGFVCLREREREGEDWKAGLMNWANTKQVFLRALFFIVPA